MAVPERRPALVKAPVAEHPLSPVPSVAPSTSPPTTTVMLSARVPAEVRDQLKMHAVWHRRTVQEVVLAALKDYLSRTASQT